MKVLKFIHGYIEQNHVPPSQAIIGEALEFSATTARQQTMRLERRGLLTRVAASRYYNLGLTEAGLAKVAELSKPAKGTKTTRAKAPESKCAA